MRLVRIWLVALTGLLVLGGSAVGAARPGSEELNIVKWFGTKTEGLAAGPHGRIVLAGRFYGFPHHPWVRAYLPDGRLDPLFGEEGQVWLGADWRRIVGALVQPDGRILVAQTSEAYSRQEEPHLVRRLNPDGTPDTTFGSGGTLQPGIGDRTSLADIALQPDGRVIVVGTRTTYSPDETTTVFVTRYFPDGSPDMSFGSNRSTEFTGPFTSVSAAVAVQPSGGVVVTARGTNGRLYIARLSSDGRLDPSFGTGGVAPVQFGNPGLAEPQLWMRAPSPVVAEGGAIRVPVTVARGGAPPYRMALLGLTPDGQPDLEFGRLGLAVAPPPPSRYSERAANAISDPSGSIIVASRRLSDHEFIQDERDVLRRFRIDGTLDRSFGDRGVVRGRLRGGGYDVIDHRLAFLDTDTLVSTEYSYDGKYGFWGAATLRTVHAGYDGDDPSISFKVRGCRSAGVRIRDTSGLERAVVRLNRRVVRSTARKRFRVRTRRGGLRLSVRATDFAGNSAVSAVRLPRC